jgi:hypothetical protein
MNYTWTDNMSYKFYQVLSRGNGFGIYKLIKKAYLMRGRLLMSNGLLQMTLKAKKKERNLVIWERRDGLKYRKLIDLFQGKG